MGKQGLLPQTDVVACCPGETCRCACTDDTCPSVLSTALTEHMEVALAAGFAALADAVRLRLVSLLSTAPDGTVRVCDLIAPLDMSQSMASHHLTVLNDADPVVGDKR